MWWTCNARSLMAFLSLRNKPDAQLEIRKYAEAMEAIFLEKMPVTARAFIDSGRVAP
jgi:thymidylate synthase ThyX